MPLPCVSCRFRVYSYFWYVFKVYHIHIVFPGVSISLCSVTLCSRLPGGEETGLGSSDGKVGQRAQPSTGELLKRPGEMMSWTLSFPPLYVFFLPPPAAEKPGSGSRARLWPNSSCTSEKHTTLMTSLSWNKASIHQKMERPVMKDWICRIENYSALLYWN